MKINNFSLHRLTALTVLWLFTFSIVPNFVFGQKNYRLPKDLISKPNPTQTTSNESADNSIFFEANHGQHDKRVDFVSRHAGQTFFLSATDAVWVLPMPVSGAEKYFTDKNFNFTGFPINQEKPAQELNTKKEKRVKPAYSAVRMKIIGANAKAAFAGLEQTPTKINYFKGKDANKHQKDIPTFRRVRYENVYEGIGAEWYVNGNNQYEYDFKVQPHKDFRQIELEFTGAEKLTTDSEGNLLIHTKAGILRHKKPYSYQNINNEQKEVTSNFELRDAKKVGFTVANYDKTKELTIDPTLIYGTYLGGSAFSPNIIPPEGGDYFGGMDIDNHGQATIVSGTYSVDYPVTPGGFDITPNGNEDSVVSKLSNDGRTLIYSTFIGGDDYDDVFDGGGIKTDSVGNVCIWGLTESTDFPVTAQAYQRRHNDWLINQSGQRAYDGFITKLNPQGNGLVFSTYFGGTTNGYGDDYLRGLTLDQNGNIYLTGMTLSTQFPISANAFQTSMSNSTDAFIAKLNADGSQMIFSTYLGGSRWGESGTAIAVDEMQNVYVAGTTQAFDFPTTAGAFDRTLNPQPPEMFFPPVDGFVTKINSTGTSLIYSTYLGGGRNENFYKIKLDDQNRVFITGGTFSDDFPVTPNAFRSTLNGGSETITQLNESGSALIYSTYFPSSGADIILENNGNLLLAGSIGLSGFPYSPNAFDRSPDSDASLVRFNPLTNQILYATAFGGKMGDIAFGGSHSDGARSVAMDVAGNIYLAGGTRAIDFPTTEGAFDRTWNGYSDGFVAKFSFAPNAITNLSGRTRYPFVPFTSSRGIARIRIKLTDSQTGEVRYQMTRPTGRYEFRGLPANRNYTIEVSDKRRFTNTSETIQNAEGDIGGIDFILAP